MNEYNQASGQWVTVNKRHIFIKDGESPQEAFDRTFWYHSPKTPSKYIKTVPSKDNKADELETAKKKLAQLKRTATLKANKYAKLTEQLTYDGRIVSKDIQPHLHKERERANLEAKEARAKVREFEEQCKKQFGDRW